jgi:tetratricopeptide (TPR) repeat protein
MGWAAGATAGAPAPAAWTVQGLSVWLSVPFHWSYLIVGVATGVGSFIALHKWFGGNEAPLPKPGPTYGQMEEVIRLLRAGPLTIPQAREAAAFATEALPEESGRALIGAPAYAERLEEILTSADQSVRDAGVFELSGEPEQAIAALVALGERESAQAATRFREAAALAAPRSVKEAISLYARATDLDPTDLATWIELSRLHQASGSLPEARRTAERARQYAGNTREIMVAECELGIISVAEGDLARSRSHFEAALTANKVLVDGQPDDLNLLRDLSVIHERLGEVAVAAGDLGEAKAQFAKSLAIRARLEAADAGHTGWQRDLSVSHNKLGEVAVAAGDLDEAKAQFAKGLAIAERLAAVDAGNTEWQRDLSNCHNKLGDVAVALGDLGEAKAQYAKGLAHIRACRVAAHLCIRLAQLAEAHGWGGGGTQGGGGDHGGAAFFERSGQVGGIWRNRKETSRPWRHPGVTASPCTNCWKPAHISATRPTAGTRR